MCRGVTPNGYAQKGRPGSYGAPPIPRITWQSEPSHWQLRRRRDQQARRVFRRSSARPRNHEDEVMNRIRNAKCPHCGASIEEIECVVPSWQTIRVKLSEED